MTTLAIIVATIAVPVAVATAGTSKQRCAPVVYALDASVGPLGAARIVSDVLDEIEMMSGVHFVSARVDRPGSAPVRVAWAERAAKLGWGRHQLGYATVTWSHADGDATIVAGEVLFRHPVDAEQIHDAPVDWYTVVRHEIGHLMGLPHEPDSSGVMHPILMDRPQGWTSADRANLRARGQVAGCDAVTSEYGASLPVAELEPVVARGIPLTGPA